MHACVHAAGQRGTERPCDVRARLATSTALPGGVKSCGERPSAPTHRDRRGKRPCEGRSDVMEARTHARKVSLGLLGTAGAHS